MLEICAKEFYLIIRKILGTNMKYLKYTLYFTLALVVILIIAAYTFYKIHYKPINPADIGVIVEKIKVSENRIINTAKFEGNNENPWLVFIHGTPGDWTNFQRYLADDSLRSKYNMMSYDRYGHGQSNAGKSDIDIARHAQDLKTVLAKVAPNKPVILFGYSYGGPIAINLAMDPDFKDRINYLVLLAATSDPNLIQKTWYQALGNLSVSRLFLSDAINHATDEMLGLKAELKKLKNWDQIKAKTLVIHGINDGLVPAHHVEYTMQKLKENKPQRYIYDAGHGIPWSHRSEITDILLNLK